MSQIDRDGDTSIKCGPGTTKVNDVVIFVPNHNADSITIQVICQSFSEEQTQLAFEDCCFQ